MVILSHAVIAISSLTSVAELTNDSARIYAFIVRRSRLNKRFEAIMALADYPNVKDSAAENIEQRQIRDNRHNPSL
ncbi:hypothetical protein K438DRAFT_1830894 [Mycena galopus ATCC 62051]|nr:hypothetical protein K438DRAFT_1830894 [Mycena galopus ATCC 62051]